MHFWQDHTHNNAKVTDMRNLVLLGAILTLLATPVLAAGIHVGPGGITVGPDRGDRVDPRDHRDYRGERGPRPEGRDVGRGRHYYNGAYYDYGIGDCWVPYRGRFLWICD